MLFPVALLATLLIVVVSYLLQKLPRSKIPDHMLGHKVFWKEDLVARPLVNELMGLVKEMKEFPNNIDQNKVTGFVPVYEDLGEGQPIEADGKCKHPLLFPNSDKTKCILPQRMDIGKHFLLTGGFDGVKENYKDAMNRVSSFGRYTFLSDIEKYPVVKKLFYSEDFQTAAKSVCPNYNSETVLDTFQFSFVMQVPGQTVALHLDGPYFWGATRFHYPQWLLACMVFSGLFQEEFIHQIQVVSYLHDWKMNATTGGDFVWYTSNDENSGGIGMIQPSTGSGVIVDGSKTVHAANIYRPDVKAPVLDKDQDCILTYQGEENWDILCNGKSVGHYHTRDLRITLVYRARCFQSQAEKEKYHSQTSADMMPLDSLLNRFKNDLIKNKGFSEEHLNKLSPLDFAMLLMDKYLKYPLPPKSKTLVPYNYCALPLLVPFTKPFFDLICA
jgi:hypothetical protein